jgi:hypothetical protein
MATTPKIDPTADDTPAPEDAGALTPLNFSDYDYVPGKYAAWDVSPEPIFGPDQLGSYKSAVDDLTETATRADSAARLWEVLQAWELQLMVRNYQFINSSKQGWGMVGAVNGSRASGSEIMQSQNSGKMFSVNVLGARQDKITSALAQQIPGVMFVPKRDDRPEDQTAADEAEKYVKIWLNDSNIKEVVGEVANLFYTDDRVVLYTHSVADEQTWDTETPDEPRQVFGEEQAVGVAPESEMIAPGEQAAEATDSAPADTDVPAVREITESFGKLEAKVPMMADKMAQMPWLRLSKERNNNTLKAKYPWIKDKIISGGNVGGSDQMDRMARINVRLAVQTSTSSGESWQQDSTETFTWYRPSQYFAIKDEDAQKVFFDNFPRGLLVVHAAGELAFVRNEGMNKKLTVLHAKQGPGQNRRAIGTNYLPIQKVLNANISLLDRYFRSCVPRRYAMEPYIDVQAMNSQSNDPAKATPVTGLPSGMTIPQITGVENVPQPTTGIFEFVQWCIDGAPEAMDGAQPAMFGGEEGGADQGVFQTAKLKRDTALQVYSMPWSQICYGIANAAQQAVISAAQNRVTDIGGHIPGEGRLKVELAKLQGDALCYPETLAMPQTMAEQEAQAAGLLENGKSVALYNAIASDPRNLTHFGQFPSLSGLTIPGLDAVEEQEGEFELLMQSGPMPNPQLLPLLQQIQAAEGDPEAQTPQGQQALQQLQQAAQSMPPQVSSVPVAQDGSQNHAIHSAITLGLMTSTEGRKFKNGTPEQQAIYANLKLHWQEHEQMKAKLTPVPPIDAKFSVTAAIDKAPPSVQAQAWGALGVQAPVADWEDSQELVPHEVTVEKNGVDANGVPVKQKTSMVNPSGKLS